MAERDIVNTLVLAVIGLVGTVVIAVISGWIVIQAGLSQIFAIGVAFVAAAIAVLAFLGLGGQSTTASVETTVNIDEDDLRVRLDNREKEINHWRAGFPERRAKFLRARGWRYARLQKVFKILISVGVFTVVVFGGSLTMLILEQLGANVPLQLVALSERMLSVFDANQILIITGVGASVTTFSIVGYTDLSWVFETTTCDDCDKDFCLSFEYALYVPGSGEKDYEKVYDNEGNVQGTEVSGYTYKGPLYTTCTTRDELVEREGWSWYVST